MVRQARRRQRGQIVPIAALLMIVIIGFAALIIDGGRGYADRRDLQAAADTAALSGAGFLGARLGTTFDLSCAVTAAVYEAAQNVPGGAPQSPYIYGAGGACPSLSAFFQYSATGIPLTTDHRYTMDVTANIQQITVAVHHKLDLTFGVAAGFGPSITPGATATAENGGLPFALVLFRTNNLGSADTANLTFSGSSTFLCIIPKGTPCSVLPHLPGTWTGTRANALSNESLCPLPGVVDFRGTGDMYSFNFPSYPSNCAAGGTGVLNTYSGNSGVNFPFQLADPQYPEKVADTAPGSQSDCTYPASGNPTCSISFNTSTAVHCLQPGTYDTVDVKKGTLVLLPGRYRIADSTGTNNKGFLVASGTTVITADQVTVAQLGDAATVGCASLGGHPLAGGSASAVTVQMTPQPQPSPAGTPTGTDGNYNQFSVSSGSTVSIHSGPQYSNIAVYVEHPSVTTTIGGTTYPSPCVWNSPPNKGCGSSVVNFSSGATYNVAGVVYGYGDNMTFGGGAGGEGIGQVFAWTMFVNGGGTLTETYDPGNIPFLQGLLN
jgi:Flp pilus assembly protein TadG